MTVLWDASYTLETSTRIALGQMPYRDFPLSHAPLTFLMQAAILRLFGRIFWHHLLYSALAGAAATVLSWRLVLDLLRPKTEAAWWKALVLSCPLVFLGIYGILPFSSYDPDCSACVLLALWCWRKIAAADLSAQPTPWRTTTLCGAALALPLFAKQNIGLPFLLTAVLVLALLPLARRLRTVQNAVALRNATLPALAGLAAASVAGIVLVQPTVGLGNYLHWTVTFAAERRLPGLQSMLDVYRDPELLWQLPSIAAGALLLRFKATARLWPGLAAAAFFSAPFLWVLGGVLLAEDAGDRTDYLLALWPLLLILAAGLALIRFAANPSLRTAWPFLVLAAIHGALLSQQLWGSTYGIWPLLILLLAEGMAAVSAGFEGAASPHPRWISASLFVLVAATLTASGARYALGEERLSYARVEDGDLHTATVPALRGLSAPGPYISEFEELLRFADREIPDSDGIILLPGEDPFYFATGRTPRFPVLLFDPATDPYSPADLAAEAHRRNIRWVIFKRNLQIKENPTPDAAEVEAALLKDFRLYRTLSGYQVYRRAN